MEIEIDTVYNIDCLELMREMVRQGIKADWCITDPPYGIGEDGKKNHSRGTKRAPAKHFLAKSWDKQRIGEEYFNLMFQCSKNQLIFGGNYYTDILPPTNNWAVWDKRCSDNQKNDFSDCELAWVSLGGLECLDTFTTECCRGIWLTKMCVFTRRKSRHSCGRKYSGITRKRAI